MTGVAQNILALAQLVGRDASGQAIIDPRDVQHFVAGSAEGHDVSFTVPDQMCAVVVGFYIFSASDAAAQTSQSTGAGQTLTQVYPAQFVLNGDLFYVFGPGRVVYSVGATAKGGETLHYQIQGYFLPGAALAILSRMQTQIFGE